MAGKTADVIELAKLDLGSMKITLIGDTPLIVHAWSEKSKREMLNKHMKKAEKTKEAKDPVRDFEDSLYKIEGGGYGFPSVAFKAAAVTACTSVGGITKVAARQAFRVIGEPVNIKATFNGKLMRTDLVRIQGSEPEMREDMVRIGMGTADIRYRGQFFPWFVQLHVKFNAGVLSAEQLVNLFEVAGFAVGVGEWRSEKDGTYGAFHVATDDELRAMAA